MPTKTEVKNAVRVMLNDVIEQSFHHLVHHPQASDELNRIIKDATEELNYLSLKVDAHSYSSNSVELEAHYRQIAKDVNKKSLLLLGRLQKLQSTNSSNVSDS